MGFTYTPEITNGRANYMILMNLKHHVCTTQY